PRIRGIGKRADCGNRVSRRRKHSFTLPRGRIEYSPLGAGQRTRASLGTSIVGQPLPGAASWSVAWEGVAVDRPGVDRRMLDWVALVCVGQLLLWSIAFGLTHTAPEIDSAEQFVCAFSLENGYWQHPPMPSWILHGLIALAVAAVDELPAVSLCPLGGAGAARLASKPARSCRLHADARAALAAVHRRAVVRRRAPSARVRPCSCAACRVARRLVPLGRRP